LAQGRGETGFEDPLSRLRKSLAGLGALNRELGVYAAIALLIPGGSLIALCVWALRHREASHSKAVRP
jgi:hypothetical protein